MEWADPARRIYPVGWIAALKRWWVSMISEIPLETPDSMTPDSMTRVSNIGQRE